MERGDAERRASVGVASAGPEGGETVILRRSSLRSGAFAAESLGDTDIVFWRAAGEAGQGWCRGRNFYWRWMIG